MREGFTYLVAGRMDISAINQACQALIGKHDFASFATGDGVRMERTVREVYRAEALKDEELVVFDMVANAFLPHQVRNTVGTLIRVGLGLMNVNQFFSIVQAKTPGLAGPTAPACGQTQTP